MKNLNYIVQNYRLSNGIVSTQYDQQFLQWAVNGLKKMKQLGLFQEVVKAVELPVNHEKHTANLPNDFDTDSLIRMGVCRHGVFIQFDLNDYLCLPKDTDCACATDEEISAGINACCDGGGEGYPTWVYPIYGQPYSYSYTVNNYAVGPGFRHGGYKIDYAKRQIQFDRCVTVETVIMEYFGDVTDDAGNTIISEGMEEVLLNWIHYCRCRFSPDASMRREQVSAKSTWYQSVRDLNSNQQALNKYQWLELMRRFCYQGVKA